MPLSTENEAFLGIKIKNLIVLKCTQMYVYGIFSPQKEGNYVSKNCGRKGATCSSIC